MANRSNRRRKNPSEYRCEEHENAIGNWRANSPLWPGIVKSMQQLEAGYTCAVVPHCQKTECLQTRRGPYTYSRPSADFGENWKRPFAPCAQICEADVQGMVQRPPKAICRNAGLGVSRSGGLPHLRESNLVRIPRQLRDLVAVAFVETDIALHDCIGGQLEMSYIGVCSFNCIQKRGANATALMCRFYAERS